MKEPIYWHERSIELGNYDRIALIQVDSTAKFGGPVSFFLGVFIAAGIAGAAILALTFFGTINRETVNIESTMADHLIAMDEIKPGDRGLAVTDLRPAGRVLIGNIAFEAVSLRGLVKAGSIVVVVDPGAVPVTVETDLKSFL